MCSPCNCAAGWDKLTIIVPVIARLPFIVSQVVMNEVVIDRGISPFLTNLEAYCDGIFVTRVQVIILCYSVQAIVSKRINHF